MTTVINDKIKEIASRRNFDSFWEAYDFFKLASYDELTSVKIGLELFNGNVWTNVINAAKKSKRTGNFQFFSGSSYYVMSTDTAIHSEPDDIDVEIFTMTKLSNPVYIPIYKAYLETRQYKEIPELESHIKKITTTLTTELTISLFNNGHKQF